METDYALHTDLYQINMIKAYWEDGIHNRESVFELFFRKLPFGNGYGVFAGLERVVDYLTNLEFSDEDIMYLKELGYEDDFLIYLKGLKFTGKLKSLREGDLVFDNEPILQVIGSLAEAQLVETALLNIVNYQTLIATKASRIAQIVPEGSLFEFGTRRAQEMDAAVWGSRAAYIAGFDGTSNVKAGKKFGIPVKGTHAHAFVQVYNDDYIAFSKYAASHKDCVFLVDTFDTLKSGVPNAIKVAKELGAKINFVGIRLDSGDMAYLSKEARRMLDEAGFTETKIVASNDLDETTILNLQMQGARIDDWGIGTKLITGYDQPALGAVYKLVALKDESGEWLSDRIKISGNPEKVTTPGLKKVYRIVNKVTGRSEGDYISLYDEDVINAEKLKMFDPVHTYISKFVTNFDAIEVLVDVIDEGSLIVDLPLIDEIRSYHNSQLDLLWDEYKRLLNPERYPVDLSQACWDNKMAVINKIKEKLQD